MNYSFECVKTEFFDPYNIKYVAYLMEDHKYIKYISYRINGTLREKTFVENKKIVTRI